MRERKTMSESGTVLQRTVESTGTRQGIVVLDFGGQYTQLIARRIREQEVFSAVLPCTASIEEVRAYEPVGLVLSGGPSSVYEKDAPICDAHMLDLGIPVLGICYGMQWLTYNLGGKVERADRREYGRAQLEIERSSPLFTGLPGTLNSPSKCIDQCNGRSNGAWLSRPKCTFA